MSTNWIGWLVAFMAGILAWLGFAWMVVTVFEHINYLGLAASGATTILALCIGVPFTVWTFRRAGAGGGDDEDEGGKDKDKKDAAHGGHGAPPAPPPAGRPPPPKK
ncbi:MAG: hypothetical protein FJX47_03995 [Alphaproteobacteria bacterium]|nr:hypothetical protein [Alphaproteobacteria bacterium]